MNRVYLADLTFPDEQAFTCIRNCSGKLKL